MRDLINIPKWSQYYGDNFMYNENSFWVMPGANFWMMPGVHSHHPFLVPFVFEKTQVVTPGLLDLLTIPGLPDLLTNFQICYNYCKASITNNTTTNLHLDFSYYGHRFIFDEKV